MVSITDTVSYIRDSYPHKSSLSNSRLIRIIYLSDWRSAILRSKQLTDARWKLNGFDPVIKGIFIENCLKESEKRGKTAPTLSKDDKEIVDYAINTSSGKKWEELVSLVCSTYPFLTKQKSPELNLVELAKLYIQTQQEMAWAAKKNSDTNTH